jgi:hypothetical protein
MEGAAEPGQTQSQPEDKQGKKMKEIQVEVDLATDAMKDTVLKIQERGQVLDHLQERSGEYFYFDYVRSLETKGDTADESDNLSISSQSFRTTATKTRRRMFLQNAKVCGRLSSRLSLFILHSSLSIFFNPTLDCPPSLSPTVSPVPYLLPFVILKKDKRGWED